MHYGFWSSVHSSARASLCMLAYLLLLCWGRSVDRGATIVDRVYLFQTCSGSAVWVVSG
jgi:hypothetical protein